MRAKRTVGRKLSAVLVTALTAAAIGAFSGPASAVAAPGLDVDVTHAVDEFEIGKLGVYAVKVINSGDETLDVEADPLTVEITVPPGLKIANAMSERLYGTNGPEAWSCSAAGDKMSASCTLFPDGFFNISPGSEPCNDAFAERCWPRFIVEPDPDVAPGTVLSPTVEACGGGAPSCGLGSDPTEIVDYHGFHITHIDGSVLNENGDPATQAGSHPFIAETDIEVSRSVSLESRIYPDEAVKDVVIDLPAGFVGNPNPNIVGSCTAVQLNTTERGECPNNSQIGTLRLLWAVRDYTGIPASTFVSVFNLQRNPGHAATLGFNIAGVSTMINVGIRSGTDYGLRNVVINSPTTLPIVNVRLKLWGVPADHGHDSIRGDCMLPGEVAKTAEGCPAESGMPERPFLSLPTRCTGVSDETRGTVTSWEGSESEASFFAHDNTEPVPNPSAIDGCNILEFEPNLEARPTTNVADTPTGLAIDLNIPQKQDPLGTATAHMRDTVLEFPEGLLLNPSAANGLAACSPEQAGVTSAVGEIPVLFTPGPAECPDNSKLAKAEIITELLERPLPGAIYLATPYDNPFDSLLAVYLMLHDPISGIVIKSPGEIELDPVTGQMTATFRDGAQLPFENLKVDFFSGPSAAFRTPSSCGTYTTGSTITPWSAPESGPPATPSDSFAITNPAVGQKSCASTDAGRPNLPRFEAGTDAPIAGAQSPLIVNLRREDGTQEFSSVKLTPPPGLVGKLAGIPACPDAALATAARKTGKAEQSASSCPAPSQVGTVSASAGAGTVPYHAPGTAYLTGPYKGAPLGLAIITPAVAGPFDLGTIVTRVALHIDPVTTQIRALADPIPHALQGIQLDLRTVSIRLDRPGFTRNPTSCNAMAFTGELTSVLGQIAPLQNRFQLGECGRLGFKPKLALALKGSTKRRGHPSLTAVLTNRPGDANISSVSVALPPNEQLDQGNIGTVCTRVQFAASACPAASVYGHATVSTPILDYELTGPVYLRSSNNKLPDLVPDLRGPASQPIRLEAAGRTDTVKGGLRNSFEFVPDVPFSKLVLTLNGGKKGLLVNSLNVCKVKSLRATVSLTAHNGLYTEQHPRLKTKCAKKKKKAKRSSR